MIAEKEDIYTHILIGSSFSIIGNMCESKNRMKKNKKIKNDND